MAQTQSQNAWLYYCTKQGITVACNQESYKISLVGVGKIEIPEYCVVYTDSLILTPSKTITTAIHRDFAPENTKLIITTVQKKIIDTRVPQSTETHKSFRNLNRLAHDAQELSELKTLYEDITNNIYCKTRASFCILVRRGYRNSV